MPESAGGTGIGAVVLAAGAGRRMGHRPKSLLERDGEPLLLRQVRLLAQAGCARIVVVLGHHRQALLRVLEPAQARYPSLTWVTNPKPEEDPATSLAYGLRALPPDTVTLLVALGDQPLLQEGDAQAVLHAWRTRQDKVHLVVPVHGGEPGHPLAFGAVLRAAVQAAPRCAPGGARIPIRWRNSRPSTRATPRTWTRPRHWNALRTNTGVRLAWPA